MSSLEDSAVLKSQDLVRLLQMGVVIEEYAEEKSAYMLAEKVDDDEGTRDLLDDAREESREHREILLGLIDEVKDREIEEDRIEELVKEAIERTESRPEDRLEALNRQRDSEMLAYEFYDNVVDALRDYDGGKRYDERDVEQVIETVKEIRRDELEDANKLESMITEEKNE